MPETGCTIASKISFKDEVLLSLFCSPPVEFSSVLSESNIKPSDEDKFSIAGDILPRSMSLELGL